MSCKSRDEEGEEKKKKKGGRRNREEEKKKKHHHFGEGKKDELVKAEEHRFRTRAR